MSLVIYSRALRAAAVPASASNLGFMAALDLRPAQWLWFPSRRTLANTFVLFRKELLLDEAPKQARGWVFADSRYRLTVNGQRVQWGPAPFDPRWPEVDPLDLAPYFVAGTNVIGIEVLHFGHGEGTWPCGKPGMIFRLELDDAMVVSDASWRCCVDRSHRPGQYRRWFLRSLQEECDLRRRPAGWDEPGFVPGSDWREAMVFQSVDGTRPVFASGYSDYAGDSGMTDVAAGELRERSIPMLREVAVEAELVGSGSTDWKTDPDDWFEFRAPGCFDLARDDSPEAAFDLEEQGRWVLFRLPEGMVGWPYLEISAPEGTVVELMPHEAHNRDNEPWLDSGFYGWSRFITREGRQRLETFDYEAFRWLQAHIRGKGRVKVHGAGIRRRLHPWLAEPGIRTSDQAVQRVMEASLNTLNNSAQETFVDGMARERQQYSGDGGHQLIAARYALGAFALSARFVRTFSQGASLDGFFMDSWPAYDRLARVAQKQVGASYWGPILDHGVGFVQDCHRHWMHTGDREAVAEAYPRLKRFVDYLLGLKREGLLPVEDLGVCNVWIDHEAYWIQRDRQCAFNLYAIQMLRNDMARLAEAMGDDSTPYRAEADALEAAAVAQFWDVERSCWVVNRPWADEPRSCDRSLGTWLMDRSAPECAEWLAAMPEWVGRSYPANAIWRYWGLAAAGRIQAVIDDLRTRWASMNSVKENNTLQEFWDAPYDGTALWSHCPVGPLIILYEGILGIRPLEPGFGRVRVAPQFGDLPDLVADAHTPHGPIHVEFNGSRLQVLSPVPGEVLWRGATYALSPGVPLDL